MIQHNWTVACRVSLVDRESNNVSLIEVVEEILVPSLPIVPRVGHIPIPAFFDLVTLWSRENPDQPEVGSARQSFVAPTGETLLEQVLEVDLREKKRMRTVSKLLGLPILQVGVYHWKIERRAEERAAWEQVAWVPLAVDLEQPAEPAPNAEREQRPAASSTNAPA